MLAASRFHRVRWTASTGSTNDDLVAAAISGEPEQVAITDLQTAGRGRRQRVWHAPQRSSAMFSVLIRDVDPADAFWRIGAVSLAAVAAVRTVTAVEARLKWPNDLLIGERKFAGVLAQMAGDALVVGMGMNVNWPRPLPAEIADGATSVNHHVANEAPIDRAVLLGHLLLDLERQLSRPFAALRHDWIDACSTIGLDVRVETESGDEIGRAVDVAADGALVLERQGERQTFHVGDVVHLRPLR